MREDGFGPTGNMLLFTVGFFLAVIIANTYGINLRDLKLAVAWGLGGAFSMVSAHGARQGRHQPRLTLAYSPTIRLTSPGDCPASRSASSPVSPRLFDSLRPSGAEHQPVVEIDRRRQAEQLLQQPMHAGRVEEVAAAHDMGDALQGIVDDDRQMIAGRDVAARQDHVAPVRGRASTASAAAIVSRPRIRVQASAADAAPAPPPCRAARRKARRRPCGAAARAPERLVGRPDRAARRPDRAASRGRRPSASAIRARISPRLMKAG